MPAPDRMLARRSSSLTVREARAQDLHRVLAGPEGALALAAQDVPGLHSLRSWPAGAAEAALADLVADGLVADDERGCLIVRPRP